MYLNKLHLVNFKNYKQTEVVFHPDVNCLIGKNGQGKTNVLDAIYYLSMCKSYLNPIDSQNINFEEAFFVIQGEWVKDELPNNLYCGVKKGSKKVFKKNKVIYEKLSDHIGLFPVVMISPYDRNLISEGSEVRRKWMDGIVSQTDKSYLQNLMKYVKVLDQRNALLKKMNDFGFFQREEIEIWNDQLIRYGQPIYEQRKVFLDTFIPVFRKFYALLSSNSETVNISYKSQLDGANFKVLLSENEKKDYRKEYTTVGIHKDDLLFEIEGHPIKKYGSQGQQKTFLIALRLAQFEWLYQQTEIKPLMLLDDIFDKLDNSRVHQLMDMVSKKDFGQVFVTDTDVDRVEKIFNNISVPYALFEVKNDQIHKNNV
ncbi:MAG: DNA replication/repair protein RecF [Crocinitomicaceae bacterium]|nr:DNA replication/repair protein RecF [Crocinitomicaceae bacterium]